MTLIMVIAVVFTLKQALDEHCACGIRLLEWTSPTLQGFIKLPKACFEARDGLTESENQSVTFSVVLREKTVQVAGT